MAGPHAPASVLVSNLARPTWAIPRSNYRLILCSCKGYITGVGVPPFSGVGGKNSAGVPFFSVPISGIFGMGLITRSQLGVSFHT